MNHCVKLVLGLAATLACLAGSPAFAQSAWPSKPITYVVPYPPGGTTDILGRAIAQRLSAVLGSPVIVENKAGATGTIGGALVARAAADGYTLLGTSIGPQAIVPHLMTKLPYDAARAYEPVSLVGTVPHVLVVGAASGIASVQDLVAALRAAPGTLTFASGGNGTILQMQGELLKQQLGVDAVHVAYKGDSPAVQDVMSGQAHFMFAPVTAILPLVQAGRLKALAVTSSARLRGLPKVPTMAEAGIRDFVVEQWQAVYAPAGTPRAIVDRLHREITRALHDPSIAASLENLGVVVVAGSPDELAQRQREDFERWGKVIRSAGIRID